MGKVTARKPGEVRYEGKVLSRPQVRAVLDTVAHRREFTSVRDHALLRLLYLGLRREEVLGLREADIDLRKGEVRVVGKGDAEGDRTRYVTFGKRTAEALDDYLAFRERHPLASRPELWIGKRGALTGRGIHAIVAKRGRQAGIVGLYPHKFRHTAASHWLEDDGNEGHLMENMGWKSREMVDRYGKATRAQRARDDYRRHALDDRI
jgi:integrase/recombinase XerD